MTETIETVELKTYELLTAAIGITEQRCVPTVVDIIAALDLEDAVADLTARGAVCEVYALHQQAWREASEVSGLDPRESWIDDTAAEAALTDFFTDRDSRDESSYLLKGGA